MSKQPVETSQPCRETRRTPTSTLTCRSYNNSFKTSRNRPCVLCAWTGWRTWSSCAATEPASCAGIEWASVPSAARPSNAAYSSTRPADELSLLLLKATLNTLATRQPHLLLLLPPSSQPPASARHILFCPTNAFSVGRLRSGGIPVTKQGKSMNWLKLIVLSCRRQCSQKERRLFQRLHPFPSHPPIFLFCVVSIYSLNISNSFPVFESKVQIQSFGCDHFGLSAEWEAWRRWRRPVTVWCKVLIHLFAVQCPLQPDFIVFVNIYSSVFLLEAPLFITTVWQYGCSFGSCNALLTDCPCS